MWPFSTTVHHEITVHPDALTRARLEAILTMVRDINRKVETIMATEADFATRLTEMETATTSLATQFQALRDQLATGGISAGAEEQFLAAFDAKIATLKAIGTPTVPTPPTE